ncbi:hypothetical protein [Iningainema tapete]|uniref:Uncharacterized protein n=1 Tax=Iningainema tapete BLCC-T55 TaxID=2748662 RepID=A0A8J7BZV2_9CYAN|nr:hypothetical protein [Iningainema tapete]MBD2776763.1 hypothetical protein [Iningainema tapete BLCC-T55]
MTLQELQNQALQLSIEKRWQLVNVLLHSLQTETISVSKQQGLAASLIGIAKTNAPPPTDEEVQAMLNERRVNKYL